MSDPLPRRVRDGQCDCDDCQTLRNQLTERGNNQ